ncbi:MAG: ribonuclease H [Pseudomonadota bacterium]|nr:ribonuclease H [Pseudomonadota bacterium]
MNSSTPHSESNTTQLHIYTDGGYQSKHHIGGWGYVFILEDSPIYTQHGSCQHSSSLEMELMAAVQALSKVKTQIADTLKFKEFESVILHTDSKILIEGLEGKIERYRQQSWLHLSGRPVESKTLWEKFDQLTDQLNVTVKWVKGHNGNLGNQMADELARQAIQTHLTQ